MRVQQADVPPTRASAAATLGVQCCLEARRHAAVQEVIMCPRLLLRTYAPAAAVTALWGRNDFTASSEIFWPP